MITINQYLMLFISTFVIVGVLTPVMRHIALRINFIDQPNASHKSHKEAVPYLGGVSIILGIIGVTFTALISQENMRDYFWIAASFFGPALILGIVGLIDDRKNLNPLPRFIAQSIAGVFSAVYIISTETMGNPSGNVALDAVITVFWIVGISNSINFFDNLDGGAAGTLAATALGLFLIANSNGQFLISASAISIFAATLGFLFWNKSPATIYMGDCGALFLGMIVAVLSIRLNPKVEEELVSFVIPILLLAVPILDTSVAIISRLRRRKSIFKGGKDHLSHRLIRKGFSKSETAFLLWSLSALYAALATMIVTAESESVFLALFSGVFWIFLFIIFLNSEDE